MKLFSRLTRGGEAFAAATEIAAGLEKAAQYVAALGIGEAACLGNVTLPSPLRETLTLRPAADASALAREGKRCGAVLADAAHAREASGIVARLRREAARARGAAAEDDAAAGRDDAAPACGGDHLLNIDDALAAENAAARAAQTVAPTPAEPAQARTPKPAFLLWVDDLSAAPSLADLPGSAPDLAILSPSLAAADAGAVKEACLQALVCALDTLAARDVDKRVSESAYGTASWALEKLSGGSADGVSAAAHLLERGHEGGEAFSLGRALSARYGLPAGAAMASALLALLPADGWKEFPALRRILTEAGVPAVLPCLRLMDVPDIAGAAADARLAPRVRRPARDMEKAVRSLYAPPAGDRPSLAALVDAQRTFFASGRTLDVPFRLRQLRLLSAWIDENESAIEAALLADLGKCAFEAYETEILLVKDELRTLLRHLPAWQRDRRVAAPLMHFPSRCRIVRNPYGLALIMAPWNYPFLLSVDPLLAAVAGGNCVVLKPSAYAPATSALLAGLARTLFDPEYVAVVEGGRAENQSLLAEKFDTIFFTGSREVGRLVMKSAAEHLTPVTLELGGKSPCIVDGTADIALAARRIAWGKFINAGQTCVAPDYVLCEESVADALTAALAGAVKRMYGEKPLANAELCRIVNEKHFDRLTGLLAGMDAVCGGGSSRETLKIEPTVLRGVRRDDPVMREEIFGPILPVLTWSGDFDALLADLGEREKPLAAYLFSSSREHEEKFLRRLRFGGGCVNDVLCHLATSVLPFGGVGESGMGAYHGRRGFDTFTHEKSILKKSRLDLPMRYAPYGERLKWLRHLG